MTLSYPFAAAAILCFLIFVIQFCTCGRNSPIQEHLEHNMKGEEDIEFSNMKKNDIEKNHEKNGKEDKNEKNWKMDVKEEEIPSKNSKNHKKNWMKKNVSDDSSSASSVQDEEIPSKKSKNTKKNWMKMKKNAHKDSSSSSSSD